MLSYRKALFEDVEAILADLSDVTRSEFEAACRDMSVKQLAKGLFELGPSDISFSGSIPLFIVGHYPIEIDLRGTWCFAGKAVETLRRETLTAASSQVERMLANFPYSQFTSVSYSTHPRRDWFFAAMGFHKRLDTGDEAVFDLLPVATTSLDS